eukprot:TRINITY_DN26919_c0_g1_i1.p1 TRINITY_DN26919_c0_g1~~TRINITY_DN26919_c0_g1_i1.p1  ORF type:complete len:613 (-),score=162.69 TRINITY_DN26919_c0_g1_i1:91-1929(-)
MAVPPRLASANETLRSEANSLSLQGEQRRQALEKERNIEEIRLANLNDEHRRKVQDETHAGKMKLDDMRRTRDQVHSKLRTAKANAMHDSNSKHCALARAGQRALTARGEADHWGHHATLTERRANASVVRDNEALGDFKRAAGNRLAAAQDAADVRLNGSNRITELAIQHGTMIAESQLHHLETKEAQANRHAQLKVGAARKAQESSREMMALATRNSGSHQMELLREYQRHVGAGSSRVAQAQRELDQQFANSQDDYTREEICGRQMKKNGMELMARAQADFVIGVDRLELKLKQAALYAGGKKVPLQEAAKVLELRKDALAIRTDNEVSAAQERAGKEQEAVEVQIARGKRLLADLQAQSASHISEILKHWEEAKHKEAEKLKDAEKRTQDLLQKCLVFKDERDNHCVNFLGTADSLAQERRKAVENNANIEYELAKQGAAASQKQAAERRRQAEARCEQVRRHLEEVQARCKERIAAGIATADEKVQLASARFADQVSLAKRRAEEAIESKDKAAAAFTAVSARCIGGATEVRARGLEEIAGIFVEAAPLPPMSTEPLTCFNHSEGDQAFHAVEVAAAGCGSFKETMSTCVPDRGTTPLDATMSQGLH